MDSCRFDNDSGQVAFCSTQGRWLGMPGGVGKSSSAGEPGRRPARRRCSVEEVGNGDCKLQNGAASLKKLETEIVRLRDDVASLKSEIVALKEPQPPRPPGRACTAS